METTEAIRTRRSIRAFSDQPVDRALLRSLVEAAAWAPTASNVQAWRFCVVDDPDLVRKLDLVSPGLSGKPPVIVVALSDRQYARARGGVKAADEFAALDCAYACENLMLAAMDAGLGTCAIKSYNDAAVRSLLGVPDNLVVELLISLGYPDPAKPPRTPKRKPLEEVLTFNSFERDGEPGVESAGAGADDGGTSREETCDVGPLEGSCAPQGDRAATPTPPEHAAGGVPRKSGTAESNQAHSCDLELLAYMVTSAAGLRGEPTIYGPLRLIESSKRVALQTADAVQTADPARAEALRSLAALIAARQNDCMTDEESFYAMLDEAAATLAQVL